MGKSIDPKGFNIDQAVKHLSQAIQINTVSYPDYNAIDFARFDEFLHFLETAYPTVNQVCQREIINGYCPFYLWKSETGQGKKPILLIGHYDVVPVEAENEWEEPPFSGTVKDNFIWGRGALDNKQQVISVMEAAEYLINSGFQPDRDIYLVFGFDEEVGGERGAAPAARYFKEQGIEFECVIDEGGCIANGIMEGLVVPAALVGIAEKSWANIKITVSGQGGHSSMPPQHTAIGKLAQMIANVENNPMPAHLIMPVQEMFKKMAPYMPGKKMVLKNIDRLFPLLSSTLSKSPTTNAMIRTTIAFTMTEGGEAPNVLPQKASVVANLRILHGDNIDQVIAHIKNVNPGMDLEVEKTLVGDISGISPIDALPYQLMERIIGEMYPQTVVLPYLMAGGTDSRKYAGVCDKIYRFSAMVLDPKEYAGIHSTNERISIDNLASIIEFYCRFLTAYDNRTL